MSFFGKILCSLDMHIFYEHCVCLRCGRQIHHWIRITSEEEELEYPTRTDPMDRRGSYAQLGTYIYENVKRVFGIEKCKRCGIERNYSYEEYDKTPYG